MPEFYSTQDVADRLGVSIFTIRRYIQSGKLDAVKLEGGYRVSRTALDHFLAERATSGLSAEGGVDPEPSVHPFASTLP